MHVRWLHITGMILLASLACLACNQGEEATTNGRDSTSTATAPSPEADSTLAAPVLIDTAGVYRSANCRMCHGANREGTPLGPALTGLENLWTPEALVEFLRDPATVIAQDPRLTSQAKQYTSAMPRVQVDDATLKALADWLIAGG